MPKAIDQHLFGPLKDLRLFRAHVASPLQGWQKRIVTVTAIAGLLMTGALATAQPSNLGDHQVLQVNNDLAHATAKLNSALTDAKQHPGSADAQYVLAVALDHTGELHALRARHNYPYNAGYQAALKLARNNLTAQPRSDLMKKVDRLETTAAADSEQTLWTFRDAARRYHGRARVLYQRLAALEPDNNKWQRALALNHLTTTPGHVSVIEVRVHYQPALDILLHLVKSEPDNDEFQRDLATAYETIADKVDSMTGSLPAEYHDALAIRKKLFSSDETNAVFVRELAITFGKIGTALVIRGKWKAARDAVTDEFGLYEDLAAMDPANMDWQRDLATAHMHFAAIKDNNNGPREKLEGEVLDHYEKALKIRTHLIEIDPGNAAWQTDLVASHATLAEFYKNRGLDEETLSSYLDALRKMSQFAQRYPKDRGWLFYQLYFYFSIGGEYRRIQRWAAPLSQGGRNPDPDKFKAVAEKQEVTFNSMVGIVDTLVKMTDAPMK
ncbi:MAG TPA: hypothetical protein VLC92_16250 [Rhodocyclaceae bacterium]|nr:hypothetical protein [Rhodocyclaceae bacterium]